MKLFPETDFSNAYGLTETSSTIAVLGPEEHALGPGHRVHSIDGQYRSSFRQPVSFEDVNAGRVEEATDQWWELGTSGDGESEVASEPLVELGEDHLMRNHDAGT